MFSQRRKSGNPRLGSTTEHHLSVPSKGGQPVATSDNAIGPLGLNLLHAPPAAILDLIFVHGLRGGSRKTWSKTKDPDDFWPKEWLPGDIEFKDVRIHSFGYHSDWGDTEESILSVFDFGKSLLAEIANSPDIRKDGDTPIIFIGHSMGGLVIKQAFILGSENPSMKPLAERMKGIIFLATPHQGADSATLLNNILRAILPYSQKPYLSDLERNSSALQSINSQFRLYSSDLQLFSFYETQKTKIGFRSRIIVNQDSATLGYPNEASALLNASHRSICKFESPSDSNFTSLKNALVTMMRDVTQKVAGPKQKEQRTQRLRGLRDYLGVPEIPEDDRNGLEEEQQQGSCQWFTQKKQFQAWRDDLSSSPRHYWLSAQPGAGKSILAAHIIRNLEDSIAQCSYYFFKHTNPSKTTMSGCFRSLAYQMASTDAHILERLLDMKESNVSFDKEDETVVWQKLFLGCIFKVIPETPHYWVIDALDECGGGNETLSLLGRVDESFPLRIFMTSRPILQIATPLSQLKGLVYADQIVPADTRGDIEVYVHANIKGLPLQGQLSDHDTAQKILEKSCGSFVWVVLVLEEMRSAFSETDILKILEEVPQGINRLYERALGLMPQASGAKRFVKGILLWTTCAKRPLTLKELEQGLELDTGEKVLGLETFIHAACGQFVHVDNHEKVSLNHETMRTFLLREDLESEFAVAKAGGNGRIAEVCLKYLSSDEMAPPRSWKLMHIYQKKAANRSDIVTYACSHFSQHLRRSDSDDMELFVKLYDLFQRNAFCWIEHMSRIGDLPGIIRTAKDTKGFLQARAKYHPPLGKDVQHVDSWSSDLIRLHSCERAFFRRMERSNNSIHYRDKRIHSVSSSSDSIFAVGLSDNLIKLYSRSTRQELAQLCNPQPTKRMVLSDSKRLMATGSYSCITMFHLDTREQLWHARLPNECLALTFATDDKILWFLTMGGLLVSVSASDGSKLSVVELRDPSEEASGASFGRVFTCARISIELNLVAAAQRGGAVGLYEIEKGAFYGYCTREADGEVKTHSPEMWIFDFVFNPNPGTSLLAVLYHEGLLVIFDPYELAIRARTYTDAQTLACSPNGRILATGGGSGTIQLFEFESLNLLYKIVTPSGDAIRSLGFSRDSLSFTDIRENECNVWGPPILAQAELSETDSVSSPATMDPTVVCVASDKNLVEITALVCHPNGEYIFCGKNDGVVALYSTTTGKEVRVLYRHQVGVAVHILEYGSKSGLLASADRWNRFLVWKILGKDDAWSVEGPLLDGSIPDFVISQLLFNPGNERLLVSTSHSDTIYGVDTGVCETTKYEDKDPPTWRWINHPGRPDELIRISRVSAHLHSWTEFFQSHPHIETPFAPEIGSDLSVQTVVACPTSHKLFVGFYERNNLKSTSQVVVLSASSSFEEPFTDTITPLEQFSRASPNIEYIIGCQEGKLIFLDRRMWICSLDLETFQEEYYRHCFIPHDWLHPTGPPLFKVTTKGDLIFSKEHEIAVIKRALDQKEAVKVELA